MTIWHKTGQLGQSHTQLVLLIVFANFLSRFQFIEETHNYPLLNIDKPHILAMHGQ